MTTAAAAKSTATGSDGEITPPRWILLATLPLALGIIIQRFGEIFYLTRLDRVLDPFTMAARGFDLWNPFWDMGAVQFQQIGYWLPFDPWFMVAKLLHIPPWVSERLFVYCFMSLALWGFVRVADEFKVGRPATRIAAGFAYAISPVILSRIAWQSPFAMGVVLLPWVLLPLIRATKGGSTRRASAQSAIAVALIGGANAAVTLAVLPIPVLYLLTRSRGPRRASLLRWWFLFIPLATLWWLVALYFFGKYGPDVLRYTESVETTTGPTSLFEVLRGTADWVSRLPGDTNPAGFALSLKTIPILATAAVAAVGLAGLARRRLPERSFLVGTFLLGVAAVAGGYGGLFGSPAAGLYRTLLDGPLNAFRNVYKFQPLIALPLALGVAHALAGIGSMNLARTRASVKRGLVVATVVVIALASWPLWRNSLTRGPGAKEIPQAWIDANAWLSANSAGRTLVLPGIPDSEFDWGFTAQIPIQWGSDVTWATRSQAPLSGLDVVEYLDATELIIERGGSSQLRDYLRRGGFTALVVPNDQTSERYGAPPAETVRNALIASGLELTTSFGERNYGFGDLQQIDIYAIDGGAVVDSYDSAAATWLSGDIGSTLDIPSSVFGDRAYFLTRDAGPTKLSPRSWIITDGNQATAIDYGRNRNNRSYVHGTIDDTTPEGQDPESRTVQKLEGFGSLTASSVGPGIFLKDLPAFSPAQIVDGDRGTWWVPLRTQVDGSDAWGGIDPFVEAVFETPKPIDSLEIALYNGPFATRSPIDVTVATDAGEVTTTLLPIETNQRLRVAPGVTRSVKVSISRESLIANDEAVGIRELTLPGAPVAPRLVVPAQLNDEFVQPGTPDPAWVFTRNLPATSPVVSLNHESQISREFTVPKRGIFEIITQAGPTRGQALLQWLGTTPTFSIVADSTWGENPKVGPRNLVDGNVTSPWRSGNDITDDGGSVLLSMKWTVPRTISSLRLVRSDADAQPTDLVVYAGSEARGAVIDADGNAAFAPVTTDSLSLRINYAPVERSDRTRSTQMGFTSLDIPAIADLYPGPLDRSTLYSIGCGSGPSISIGGTITSYSVTTTAGALIDGKPIDLTPCRGTSVDLGSGSTLLDASSGGSLVTINRIVIGNRPTMAPPAGTVRSVTPDRWGTNERSVAVGAGTEGILVVNEAFNEGWEAILDGQTLTPMKVDGWRQAFLIPPGDGGQVSLRFGPDRPFKLGTLLGLLTLLFVVMLAIWPDRKQRALDPLQPGHPSQVLLIAACVAGAVWCTGVGAVLLAPIWWVRTHRRSWLAPVAFLAMVAAGVLTVIGKRLVDYPSPLWGAASYPVLALSAVAFLCVLVTLIPRAGRSRTEDLDEDHAPEALESQDLHGR